MLAFLTVDTMNTIHNICASSPLKLNFLYRSLCNKLIEQKRQLLPEVFYSTFYTFITCETCKVILDKLMEENLIKLDNNNKIIYNTESPKLLTTIVECHNAMIDYSGTQTT